MTFETLQQNILRIQRGSMSEKIDIDFPYKVLSKKSLIESRGFVTLAF